MSARLFIPELERVEKEGREEGSLQLERAEGELRQKENTKGTMWHSLYWQSACDQHVGSNRDANRSNLHYLQVM